MHDNRKGMKMYISKTSFFTVIIFFFSLLWNGMNTDSQLAAYLCILSLLHMNIFFFIWQVLELETNGTATDGADTVEQSPQPWPLIFEDQRKQIIMLWHLCHVSIVHRTQFYLLFRGDPSDQIYLEVELRRLTWLEQHLAELGNASPALLGDEPAGSVSSRYVKSVRVSPSK